ncbi:2-oxo acid dehydrogenase subunit E2 [Streptomyces sp. NPDC057909]|uniref:2-oxo acid dehydrogenase subunit E2 n=1 Tax=Streptomyces sp. NPDC057909 TaxID=3346277 RepID=UPI0036E69D2A
MRADAKVTAAGTPLAVVPERQRRHTLYFLDYAFAAQRSVSVDCLVDMSAVQAHRRAAKADGHAYSLVSYVVWAGARAVARQPEANSALIGRLRPRLVRYPTVNTKVALDKTMLGRRVVLSALVRGAEQLGLDAIQQEIVRHRDGDPERMLEFENVRKLNRMPTPVGRWMFRRLLRHPAVRGATLGTLSVSCLGHRPVDAFMGAGGTTVTLNVGRMQDRPWVHEGEVTVAPVMRVNLTFDHRVIDGAIAADIIGDIKDALENIHAYGAATQPDAP